MIKERKERFFELNYKFTKKSNKSIDLSILFNPFELLYLIT